MTSSTPGQRVGIYLCVLTLNQETGNQLLQLRTLCDQQGWRVVKKYVEVESGRKGRNGFSNFAQLFKDAPLMLFWSLDCFSWEGITKTIAYLQQLDGYGVKFKSLTEPFIDSDNELVAHIFSGVLSYPAQLEAIQVMLASRGQYRIGLARSRSCDLPRATGRRLTTPFRSSAVAGLMDF